MMPVCRFCRYVATKMARCNVKAKLLFTITAELACSLANFHLSISGQTHEVMIYAMRQRARADNLLL